MPGAAAMAAHAERKSEEDDGGHQGERREGGSRLDQLQEAVDAVRHARARQCRRPPQVPMAAECACGWLEQWPEGPEALPARLS